MAGRSRTPPAIGSCSSTSRSTSRRRPRPRRKAAPTAHYMMGGVRVAPDTAAATVPGLFAAGECAGGMHGANRLGGNSLSDLVVFGRRAGLGAAEYVKGLSAAPAVDPARAAEDAAGMLGP